MMAVRDEEAALQRAVTLGEARRLAVDWGYWCVYGRWGGQDGSKPRLQAGGPERRYDAPPQFHPPEPAIPEANEIHGLAVQRAFVRLPKLYRGVLSAEFVHRPWIVPLKEGEVEAFVARRARVSIGAYGVTLERSLLALANVMKRIGTWNPR